MPVVVLLARLGEVGLRLRDEVDRPRSHRTARTHRAGCTRGTPGAARTPTAEGVVLVSIRETVATRRIGHVLALEQRERLRQVVGLDEHVARLRPLGRADDGARFEQVHEAPGLRESDAQLALQHRGRSELCRDDEFGGLQQHVEVVADVVVDLLLRRDLRDVLAVVRRELALDVRDDGVDLGFVDPCALHAHRLARTHRQEQRVTLAEQLLGTGLVEHDAAVGERRRRERQARRHVGLDDAGDDVDGRALRREDEVNARGTRELRDALDRRLDVARRDEHEVGELVDDDEQVGVRRELALAVGRQLHLARAHRLVELVDVLVAERGQVVIACVHLAHDPLECLGGLLRVRDDRRDEVRDALVRRQFDALGVDEHHAHLFGRGPHEQRRDHRVDEARLAGARRTRDEHVRHLREVRDDVAAFDVLADTHDHRVRVVARRLAAQHVAEADEFLVGVRDLDTDGLLAGDRRQDAHVGARDGVRDVLAQPRHTVDLDARAEFDLVARHRRAARKPADDGIDAELLEYLGQRVDDTVVRGGTLLGRGPLFEDVRIGQRVRDVAAHCELLDTRWKLFGGLSLHLTLRDGCGRRSLLDARGTGILTGRRGLRRLPRPLCRRRARRLRRTCGGLVDDGIVDGIHGCGAAHCPTCRLPCRRRSGARCPGSRERSGARVTGALVVRAAGGHLSRLIDARRGAVDRVDVVDLLLTATAVERVA